MTVWNALGAALLVLASSHAAAAENANPFDKALMYTTFVPSILVAGTTALTFNAPDLFKSARSDALAFVGSDGQIRGAQFEQASRHYRATARPPLMTDRQRAQASTATY